MRIIIGIAAIILLAIGAFVLWNPDPSASPVTSSESGNEMETMQSLESGRYEVDPERSIIRWAGKKPLIEGYVNSGSIALQGGTIIADDNNRSAEFTIDMNTISVSETPTKPGRESALEGHLKGKGWFDVETHPTATFTIDRITPREDTGETFMYDVSGALTLKGATHPVTFPAKVYLDGEEDLHAEASLEIDRTQWGITSGSGSFFDNLADNAIDDMVALSFHLVAERE